MDRLLGNDVAPHETRPFMIPPKNATS